MGYAERGEPVGERRSGVEPDVVPEFGQALGDAGHRRK